MRRRNRNLRNAHIEHEKHNALRRIEYDTVNPSNTDLCGILMTVNIKSDVSFKYSATTKQKKSLEENICGV